MDILEIFVIVKVFSCPARAIMEPARKTDVLARVAVIDDDEDTCLCFKDMLQSAGNFSFAGSFSSASEALAGLPALQPDVALMDIRLPDLNGIECTRRLKHLMPRLKIVMVTGTHEAQWAGASLKAGARAYLIKPVEKEQLLVTLQFALADRTEIKPAPVNTNGTGWSLSPRETEVMAGLAEGLLYKEISEKLGISYAAVHKYQHNIFKKMRVNNRSEAIHIWSNRHRG